MGGNKQDNIQSSTPLYVSVYNQINELIKTLKPGDKMPTEETLAKELNVLRNTLRQALQILQEDRVIYKRRGSGTYVSGAPYMGTNNFNVYCTNEVSLKQQGIEARMADLNITFEEADDITKESLMLQGDRSIYVVSRSYVKPKDVNTVILHSLDFIPVRCFEGKAAGLAREELIKFYERQGASSLCGVRAVQAGQVYSETLKVGRNTPLLLLQQIVMDWQGNRVYLNKTFINTRITEYDMLINRTSL